MPRSDLYNPHRIHHIAAIIDTFASGIRTRDEAIAALGSLKVMGTFDTAGEFAGYDYVDQRWIDTNPAKATP